MSNSGTVSFPGGLTVFVQSFCNAGYNQTVTIQPTASGSAAATFSGSGEGNVAMGLQTAGFLTAANPGGWPSFTTPGSASQLSLYTVTCTNSQGSSDVEANQSSFSTPAQGLLQMWTVVSEDSTDQDYNDSATLFMAYSPPPPPPPPTT
jgi:hypothetical protein